MDVVNLSRPLRVGRRGSLAHLAGILGVFITVGRHHHAADVVYLTIAESYLGNLKDLLIYLLCVSRLRRVVVHLHGGAGFRNIMARGSWLRKPNEWFLRRVGGVIILGARQAATFAAVPAGRLHVVPNFAEQFLFADRADVVRKFQTVTPLRVLFLSNFLPGKGHQELVDAFHLLSQEHQASLIIDMAGGFESDEAKTTFLARIAGIPQIRYHGPVRGDHKRDLFHQAHVFCLPTSYAYEGQPLTILEAFASGCSVITTDHSGIPDVFTAELNGFEVAPRSATSLAAALARALGNPAALAPIALANLETARARFRPEHYHARMIPIIDAIAAGA